MKVGTFRTSRSLNSFTPLQSPSMSPTQDIYSPIQPSGPPRGIRQSKHMQGVLGPMEQQYEQRDESHYIALNSPGIPIPKRQRLQPVDTRRSPRTTATTTTTTTSGSSSQVSSAVPTPYTPRSPRTSYSPQTPSLNASPPIYPLTDSPPVTSDVSMYMWDSKKRIKEMLSDRNAKQSQAFQEMENFIQKNSQNTLSTFSYEITRLDKTCEENLKTLKEMALSVKDTKGREILSHEDFEVVSTNSEEGGQRLHERFFTRKRSHNKLRIIATENAFLDSNENGAPSRSESHAIDSARSSSSAPIVPSSNAGSALSIGSFDGHVYDSEELLEKNKSLKEEVHYLSKLLERQTKDNKELSQAMKKASEAEITYVNQIARLEKENRSTTVKNTKVLLQNENLKEELEKIKNEKQKFRYIYKTVSDSGLSSSTNNLLSHSRRANESEELRKARNQIDVLQQRLKLATRPIHYEQERGPTGFVCLVFTDVESSTELWEFNLEAMTNAIMTHNAVVRSAIKIHNGYEVKTEGDAFFITFSNCHDAINCVLDIQHQLMRAQWDERILLHKKAAEVRDENGMLLFRGLRVRMGMDCGYPLEKIDETTKRSDYYGPVVNSAARVSSHARGGEILLSRSVYEEVSDLIPKPNTFSHPIILKEVGIVKLKGIENDEYLRAVFIKGLEKRPFPPRKDEIPTNNKKKQQSIESRLLIKSTLEKAASESSLKDLPDDSPYASIQNDYLKKELAEKIEVMKLMENEIQALKHELLELQKSNPDLVKAKSVRDAGLLQSEVDSLRKEIEGFKRERDVLHQTNQRLENELKTIREQLNLLQHV